MCPSVCLSVFQGPPGPQGPVGPLGEMGPKVSVRTLAALAAAVLRSAPPASSSGTYPRPCPGPGRWRSLVCHRLEPRPCREGRPQPEAETGAGLPGPRRWRRCRDPHGVGSVSFASLKVSAPPPRIHPSTEGCPRQPPAASSSKGPQTPPNAGESQALGHVEGQGHAPGATQGPLPSRPWPRCGEKAHTLDTQP